MQRMLGLAIKLPSERILDCFPADSGLGQIEVDLLDPFTDLTEALVRLGPTTAQDIKPRPAFAGFIQVLAP
jgi:hypothetical protein